MTDHTDNEYPANWHAGGGEANRPLHEGGYYLHVYCRVLPGSNQHVERFLEMRVDTAGTPPDRHVIELLCCTEDDTEVTQVSVLDTETVIVDGRESLHAQARAEREAYKRAVDMMDTYAGWTP